MAANGRKATPGTEPAVLVAALILAGYRPWWLPPVISPEVMRRGMLSSSR